MKDDIMKCKWRVTHFYYWPTYFRTRREALEFLNSRDNPNEYRIQREDRYHLWYDYYQYN